MSHLDLPWLIIGDFNAIISSDEHRGGSFHNYSHKYNLFADFISRNMLLDIGFSSP